MPILSKGDKKYLFIHIPKTGGTSIEKTFQNNGYKIDYRRRGNDLIRSLHKCSPQHFHGHMLENIFNAKKFDGIFTLVRNPYDRFRSEYAMRNKDVGNIKGDVVEQWLEQILKKYQNNPFLLDNHIRPQAEYIISGTEVINFEIGMVNVFQTINEKFDLNLDYKDTHEMSSFQRNSYYSKDVELNDASKTMINDFYKNDFDFFNYKI